ncbi:Ubiquitin-associated domain-containing protein 2 [Hondaea fermentalgiana]|uniref:Ubiquitin-associated domain-containing protein 2 n=1 Tax=Hondaea fermentalgiana TaxID=2315210 RepID=A0A2R5GPR6_9STRA|nr:Ubiquitin-associated domain-containing protein 2 [Hondaea fermentalgiana]|eukprot:GBG29874.1 Ubiquitin-associated domain-containing protein 2 [Hondaea fermentalgiana]
MASSGWFDFYQAPASKAIFFAVGLGSIANVYTLPAPWTGYDVTAFSGVQLHRVLAGQFVFGGIGELVLGLGLIYQFRMFERRMGTARFLSFTTMSTLLSITFQMAVLIMNPGFDDRELNQVAIGPYSYIFALFVHYFVYVPKLQKYRLLGAEFSEKSFMYLWGSQLLLAQGNQSAIAACCGMIGGLLCLSDKLPFNKFSWPDPLVRFSKDYLAPLFASRSPAEIAAARARREEETYARMGMDPATIAQQQQQHRGTNAQGYQMDQLLPGPGFLGGAGGGGFGGGFGGPAPPQPQANVAPPSEEDVARLTEMGFDRDSAVEALRRCNNNVARATESLLM